MAKDTEVVITVSTGEGNDMVSVANVRGIDASEAEATLTAQGLIVEIEEVDGDEVDVAYGEVYAQTPKAGNRVEKGTTVTIKVRKEGAGSDAGTTADGNKVEAGQWAAVEPKLKKPDNYQGGNVQLRLVQDNGDETSGGTVIMEGSPIDFDSNGGYYSVGSIVERGHGKRNSVSGRAAGEWRISDLVVLSSDLYRSRIRKTENAPSDRNLCQKGYSFFLPLNFKKYIIGTVCR